MNAQPPVSSPQPASLTAPAPPAGPEAARRRLIQRVKLIAILLVCAAPVIASYLAYYVFPPSGRTNFGQLIQPQRPMPALNVSRIDAAPYAMSELLGQWVLLQVDAGECAQACRDKLYALRQQRTMTGKDRDRIDRVWLITDSTRPDAMLERDFAGTIMLRADAAQLAAWLPVEPGRQLQDYLYVIDPIGNLMMRFAADGDPARIRKDIGRLLKASRMG
jgi:hypothetical protein